MHFLILLKELLGRKRLFHKKNVAHRGGMRKRGEGIGGGGAKQGGCLQSLIDPRSSGEAEPTQTLHCTDLHCVKRIHHQILRRGGHIVKPPVRIKEQGHTATRGGVKEGRRSISLPLPPLQFRHNFPVSSLCLGLSSASPPWWRTRLAAPFGQCLPCHDAANFLTFFFFYTSV